MPIGDFVFRAKIPETPIWLLSKERYEEASKSLQWLRGWVTESEIEKELNELILYRDYTNSCLDCRTSKIKCAHGPLSLADKVKQLFTASYVKPMLIITISAMFTAFTGAHHLNPYLEQILNTFDTPMDPSNVTVSELLIFGLAPHLIKMWFQSFPDFVWANGTCRHYFLYFYRQIHKQTTSLYGEHFGYDRHQFVVG